MTPEIWQWMITSMTTMNSVMFSSMKHPMAMGASLLMQTILICMMTGTMAQSMWFSYILFLVFLGGMLVLFIYMTSVASNEMFQKSSNKSMLLKAMTTTILIMMLLLMNEKMMTFNNSMETLTPINTESESNMMMMLFNYPTNTMTIFAVMYLFMTLIVVVNITESYSGPLRSKY